MPSDLNLKKSWNPKLLKNRAKVWQKEQEVLQEYKKIKQRQQEIKEINDKSELLALGHKEDSDKGPKDEYKTSWMYEGPAAKETESTGSATDDFMLGRRRLDQLLKPVIDREKAVSVSRLDKVLTSNKDEEEKNVIDKDDPMYEYSEQVKRRKLGGSGRIEKVRHHHRHHHKKREGHRHVKE